MIDFITKLGPTRMAAIASTVLLVLGFFIFMMFRVTTPNFALLYGDLETEAARKIAEKLSDQNIVFDIREENTQIWVPEEEVSNLRISMAGEGLGGSLLGYEIFDRDAALGQSNFVQQVNHLRALEGEIARTIAGMDVVSSARVHIVLPKRELFTRDRQTTKASIILKMKGNNRLNKAQVKAVQHMVSTAIPELKPENITVIDNNGVLLHAGGDTEGTSLAITEATEMRSSYENLLSGKVTQLLEHSVGFGKVRVEVNAAMDFSQQVLNQESYDPEQQVARSQENIVEKASSSEGTDGTVTVANNLPNAEQFVANGAGIRENSNRNEERTNFEIGHTKINRITPPGRLERLTIAVMVDGVYVENGDGGFIYSERPQEELNNLEALVKSAIGFDDSRGDRIELVNMQFVDAAPTAEKPEITYFGYTASEIKRYLEWLGLAGVFVMIMLLVVRPLVMRVLEFRDVLEEEAEEEKNKSRVVLNQYGQVVQLNASDLEDGADAAGGIGGAGGSGGSMADEIENLIDIAHVEGQVKASSLRRIGELIDKHPEEAVQILRAWIYSEDS